MHSTNVGITYWSQQQQKSVMKIHFYIISMLHLASPCLPAVLPPMLLCVSTTLLLAKQTNKTEAVVDLFFFGVASPRWLGGDWRWRRSKSQGRRRCRRIFNHRARKQWSSGSHNCCLGRPIFYISLLSLWRSIYTKTLFVACAFASLWHSSNSSSSSFPPSLFKDIREL